MPMNICLSVPHQIADLVPAQSHSGQINLCSLNSEALKNFQDLKHGDCIRFSGNAARVPSVRYGFVSVGVCDTPYNQD